jgi:hypothetical protein
MYTVKKKRKKLPQDWDRFVSTIFGAFLSTFAEEITPKIGKLIFIFDRFWSQLSKIKITNHK